MQLDRDGGNSSHARSRLDDSALSVAEDEFTLDDAPECVGLYGGSLDVDVVITPQELLPLTGGVSVPQGCAF